MVKASRFRFNFFRFQILPTSQDIQLDLFDTTIKTVEDLKDRKNEIFANTLNSFDDDIRKFVHHKRYEDEIIFRFLIKEEDFFVLQMGVNRDITIQTRDFETDTINNWPTVLIAVDNSPSAQKIAIQIDRRVFYRTSTVANILEYNLNRYLYQHQLQVRFNPIFSANDFWSIIEQYPQRVTQVEFAMITPNLSDISDSLNMDIKALGRLTNTQETKLQLNSAENSSLTLNKDDEFTDSMVQYSSEGGGNISMKIKGLRRKITTNDSITETSIEKFSVTDAPEELVKEILRELLDEEG